VGVGGRTAQAVSNPGQTGWIEPGRTRCALFTPLIKIILWAYSVRPYMSISVQETTPGMWEAPQCADSGGPLLCWLRLER